MTAGTATSEDPRYHGLDTLRAIAIVMVVVFHFHVYYGLPISLVSTGVVSVAIFGWSGVDLFFVLSGFLIASKLMEDYERTGHVRIIPFYVNRAFRILPAYVVALALYFSIAEIQEGRALQPLWRFLTFTQNLPIDLYANTFSHAWSLCVEEHFYLVFPFLVGFLFADGKLRRALATFLAVALIGMLVRYVSWSEFVEPLSGWARVGAALKTGYYPTYVRLDGLAIGVAIAALHGRCPTVWDAIKPHGNLWFLAGAIVLTAGYMLFDGNILSPAFTTGPVATMGFPLISVGYGLLVVSAICPGSLLYRLQLKPIAKLATYSYAIYLVHKMTNHWVVKELPNYVGVNEDVQFALAMAAAVAAGALLHLMIEKPFLMLRGRLSERVA